MGKEARLPGERTELAMEFRWVAIITLWTMLAGPMFDSPSANPRAPQVQSKSSAALRVHQK